MKIVEITPSTLMGTVNIPPSKSMSHRSIFCAALSDGISNIKNVLLSEDIKATCESMEALGAKIKYKKTDDKREIYHLRIQGTPRPKLKKEKIDCGESGSTIRFIIPLLALLDERVTVTGRGRLVSRPLDSYYEIFDQKKIYYTNKYGELPLTIKGMLESGIYELKGDVSSQFITGLMFALPLVKGDSKIVITTDLESKPYVDMTIEMLTRFGIEIVNNDYREFMIKGNQQYQGADYSVEGDFSQAAFWLSAGVLGGEIYSNDLKFDSLQGDKAIVDIIGKMGGNIEKLLLGYKTTRSNLHGTTVDASQCPDLVPIVSVLAALGDGMTEVVNAKRLRIKESDRLDAITQVLTTLGADIAQYTDGLIIRGKSKLKGGEVDSFNDHRIAMAAAIASIRCEEKVIVRNAQSVNKSYPNFWEDFAGLGGVINELEHGE
ncbi:3-phosphoshikimate 1-carboxyvinyltransferase [Alkalibacter mobilis]|uniref:3-phosphoshikimate 1-carboxyvinyltransferase n=1 Tax=Alkalibacter mobilis TaxID=2787712 RepID=UPI00189F2DB5|nr:3-phosphoshikimate 1-carboxyvinyltransferase [Alkalibacter mobilis]MBF7096435.1 3-phosphoshikimate 1-carboxyvinyltransferase [Alkalibacter mobilis]